MTRTIAHISDLHFGKVDSCVADGLMRELHELKPSIVIVSGDLTQRAQVGQFREAADYLSRLPQPLLVVPGNHDVPLFNPIRRFFSPLGRYRAHVREDLRPRFEDESLVVQGINTARAFVPRWDAFWKGGRISSEQLLDVKRCMGHVPETKFKVVVTHHPFIPAPGEPRSDLVGQAPRALRMFEECGVDMVLSGHLHLAYNDDMRSYHAAAKRSILSVHAGTATSYRRRGEANAYNFITIEQDAVTIQVRGWSGGGFEPATKTQYHREAGVWRRER